MATLQIIFMDAGQGDATLIVHPDKSLVLVDCGCKKNKDIVYGEIKSVLETFLKQKNNTLKALVLTHPDGDHYNLVDSLIVQGGVTVERVFYGGDRSDYTGLSSWLNNHMDAVSFNQGHGSADVVSGLSYAGTAPSNPSVDVRVLSANAGDPSVKADANPNSIVLLVTYVNLNFFLMGDSTDLTEGFILKKLGKELKTLTTNRRSILKVGHHGSLTSSSQAWLDAVQPRIAFISSDTRTFGGTSIPRKQVVDRIFDLNSLHDFGNPASHYYVDYNDSSQRHQQILTTKGLFTTLHLLKFEPNNINFTAYGTSWYYSADQNENIVIFPACGWDDVKKAF